MKLVICNYCDQSFEESLLIPYEESDTGHKGHKCPGCNCADYFSDIDLMFVDNQLSLMRQGFLNLSETETNTGMAANYKIWAKRLEAIRSFMVEEIEA